MWKINADGMHYAALNAAVRACEDREILIENCIGQRYIGTGLAQKRIVVNGTPGNALGAYLNGAVIRVNGNVQEATGDTMNGGEIAVAGSAGDATGYAMRGGRIFVEGDAGYRCGIHIKEYRDSKPAIVIGGRTGSFLGEYQAGGTIVVLGDRANGLPVVGNFCGTGMHGGEIFLRTDTPPARLPAQVHAEIVEELPAEAAGLVRAWCARFGREPSAYLRAAYVRLTPDSKNPYRRMYVAN